MTKIIGLTGGIGSGKSTIAAFFHSKGIPVYIADTEARKIMETPLVAAQVREAFGGSVFNDGKINRKKLAERVFNNAGDLAALNTIIHPAVKAHFESWLRKHGKFPLIIKEAAILFESGSYTDCDQIITVFAPVESRIERVMLRDKTQREEVLQRLQNQWSDEQRIANSDYVIDNTDLEKAKLQAQEILEKLMIQ